MDHKIDFDERDDTERQIVYVRPVQTADLPAEVRKQAGDAEVLYSVHTTDGQRLALVRGRRLAFTLARQNDMIPVNVH